MKNVTSLFKQAQESETSKVVRRVSYAKREWITSYGKYTWQTFVEIPESSIVNVGPITAKLDTDRLNEFKISNVDLTVLNTGNAWNPRGGSVFAGEGVEPYWTKFKIEFGYKLADGNTEYTSMFVGVAVGFSMDAGGETVKINIQGLEAILSNANAELVSTLVSNETPSGTINSVNKDFVTLNPGVGIIENVQVNSVDNNPGTHYDISQLNEPTLGAKITFKTAPPTGQTVKVWYRYWKQTQKLEDLVVDLLTVAEVETGANVQKVTFPGGVGDSYTIDSQSDWTQGTTVDGDVTRSPGALLIKMDAVTNYQVLDNFGDGNYTSNPTWTVRASRQTGWQVVSNRLQGDMFAVSTVIDTPASGRVVGCWIIDAEFISGFNGTGFSFCFSGSGSYNYDGNSIMRNHVGDRVEFWDKYTGTGARCRLVLNNTSVAESDTAWVNPTIKVIRYASGLVNVYINGTLKLSGTSSTWNSASVIGLGGFDYSYDGIWQFWNVKVPSNTLSTTWTSKTFDMTSTVSAFGTFIKNVYVGGGAITIYTRTSTDGISWDPFTAVSSDGTVNSAVKRYVQIRVIMTMPSTSHDEPYVSYLKLNYTKAVTTIKLANFTGKTCYQAIQSLGAFSNYEWGFKEDETFFFREKAVSKRPALALDYSKNIIELSAQDFGYNNTYSEVQATFGNYDVIKKDSGGRDGPLKKYGRKRLTIDGGDLLISPDTDVASGIAAGLMATETKAKIKLSAKIKLTPWVDLSDTVSVDWGTEYVGFLCKVVGVRHDLESMVTDLDLEEVFADVSPFENSDFEDDLTGWTQEGVTWYVDNDSSLAYKNEKYAYYSRNTSSEFWTGGSGGYVDVEIRNSGGTVLQTLNLGTLATTFTWYKKTIPMSSYNGQSVKIAIGDNAGAKLVSPLFVSTGEDIKFYAMCEYLGITHYNFIDYFHI